MNSYATLAMLKSPGWLHIDVTDCDTDMISILEDASREFDKDTDRRFYLWEGTRYYDGSGIKIVLDDDVYSITTLDVDTDGDGIYESSFDGTTTPPDYFTYPLNETPKSRLEANPWGRYGHFGSGIRKAIKIVGVFGYGNDWPAAPIATTSALVATGGMTTGTTTHTLASYGSLFSPGHTIKIDSEQMYVSNVVGNTLTFLRAVNGTTAAAHLAAAPISVYLYPQSVARAVLILAARTWKLKESPLGMVMGTPDLGVVKVDIGGDGSFYTKIVKKYKRMRYPKVI